MGQGGALGRARRAGGELDVDGVVDVERGAALGDLLVGDAVGALEELLPGVEAGEAAIGEQAVDLRDLGISRGQPCRSGLQVGADVSREGVQRDLLPLVEGCTVSTRSGMVKTDHILFIASGAFHLSKPSDLIPELQGRLPIRVELRALEVEDFTRILTEPQASLTEQYRALMNTEGVRLEFTDEGVRRIAEIAWQVNESTENIGARRLHTVLERLLDTVSYEAPDRSGEAFTIDAAYVDEHLDALAGNEDLSRYIL